MPTTGLVEIVNITGLSLCRNLQMLSARGMCSSCPGCHGRNFYPTNFLSHINDCIVPTTIFTTWEKFYSTKFARMKFLSGEIFGCIIIYIISLHLYSLALKPGVSLYYLHVIYSRKFQKIIMKKHKSEPLAFLAS